VRQAIVRGALAVAQELGTQVIAEGIEQAAELETLQGLGITLFQGFYFAKPAFQALPPLIQPL